MAETLGELSNIAMMAKVGDHAAMDMLLEQVIPWMRKHIRCLAAYFQVRSCVDIDECYSEGLRAIPDAIRNYDPNRGEFRSYLSKIVTRRVQAYLNLNQTPYSISQCAAKKLRLYKHTYKTLEEELGRKPTDEEMQDALGLSMKAIRALRRIVEMEFVRLDDTPNGKKGEDFLPHETIADERSPRPDEVLNRQMQLELVMRNLDRLDPREAFVIKGRYGLNAQARICAFKELADILNLSEMRVRQIHKEATSKLYRMLANETIAC